MSIGLSRRDGSCWMDSMSSGKLSRLVMTTRPSLCSMSWTRYAASMLVPPAGAATAKLDVCFITTRPATVGAQHAAPLLPEGSALAPDLRNGHLAGSGRGLGDEPFLLQLHPQFHRNGMGHELHIFFHLGDRPGAGDDGRNRRVGEDKLQGYGS
jgi:hypothetical protein